LQHSSVERILESIKANLGLPETAKPSTARSDGRRVEAWAAAIAPHLTTLYQAFPHVWPIRGALPVGDPAG
jgi:hypothetical protein